MKLYMIASAVVFSVISPLSFALTTGGKPVDPILTGGKPVDPDFHLNFYTGGKPVDPTVHTGGKPVDPPLSY